MSMTRARIQSVNHVFALTLTFSLCIRLMHNSHGRHASRETVTTGIDPQTGASLATNLAQWFSNNFRHVNLDINPAYATES
jgi:hypothetical protein